MTFTLSEDEFNELLKRNPALSVNRPSKKQVDQRTEQRPQKKNKYRNFPVYIFQDGFVFNTADWADGKNSLKEKIAALMDEQQKGKTMRNRSDFTITTEKTVRNGTMCRILYKGQSVYAFGTCPDTYQVQRRGRDNALLENAEVTIRQLMAGLVPSANVLMDALDA